MFETVAKAPPDPILGLTEAFTSDPNPNKINLSVGVYKDNSGKTPILQVVKDAERRLLEAEHTKGYKPISGDPAFAAGVQQLLFGEQKDLIASGRAASAHTPGGTGALRVVGDYLHKLHPRTTLWHSKPTWANHPKVFEAAGVPLRDYAYFDVDKNGLDFGAMLEAVQVVPEGDAVLLHACCHNPTGVDPTADQWQELASIIARRKVLPVVDFAYQGFGTGLGEDALGLRILVESCPELFICSSFSKNFSLYNERTGALTVVARTASETANVFSQIKTCIRANYSNPPAHGGAIVSEILGDDQLRARWEQELAAMRDRINGMRLLFVKTLREVGVPRDFSFMTRQKGMFSFSGLTQDQVLSLREKYAIYIVNSGRINVAGITESNVTPLCRAIADVL